MDMSIQLRTESGKICTLSLSFNNDGPLGTFFRYICDNGTYLARYDDLFTGKEEQIDVSDVDVSTNGIELQDREFIAAIREGREPNSSIGQVLDCYRILGELEEQLASSVESLSLTKLVFRPCPSQCATRTWPRSERQASAVISQSPQAVQNDGERVRRWRSTRSCPAGHRPLPPHEPEHPTESSSPAVPISCRSGFEGCSARQ